MYNRVLQRQIRKTADFKLIDGLALSQALADSPAKMSEIFPMRQLISVYIEVFDAMIDPN